MERCTKGTAVSFDPVLAEQQDRNKCVLSVVSCVTPGLIVDASSSRAKGALSCHHTNKVVGGGKCCEAMAGMRNVVADSLMRLCDRMPMSCMNCAPASHCVVCTAL